jgi:hypothetical protein
MNTNKQLDLLAEKRSALWGIDIEKQHLIDSVLTPEIRQQIKDIESEFAPKIEELNNDVVDIENSIKLEVLILGHTEQGNDLEAVYCAGRTSWDTKGLDAAIKVLPQLEQFKKLGDPYVTIRARR